MAIIREEIKIKSFDSKAFGTKRLSPSFKKQFIGMSKREAMETLKNAVWTYNIHAIDYFTTEHEVPKVIYVNFGGMSLYFDKHTRRIVEVR